MALQLHLGIILLTCWWCFTAGNHRPSSNNNFAVLTTKFLHILTEGSHHISQVNIGLEEAWALTYDPIYSFHYFAADGHTNASIFRVQVSREGKMGDIEPLVRKQPGRIFGVAYDFESDTIFWTLGQNIYYSQLSTQVNLTDGKLVRKQMTMTNLAEEKILHSFKDDYPLAIAVEPCSKYVYWSYRSSRIDRSLMDGTMMETVISDLNLPIAITIVQSERKIYWVDEGPGLIMKIGRAGLDGSLVEIVMNSMELQPTSLVVKTPSSAEGSKSIYWTDNLKRQLMKYDLDHRTAEVIHNYTMEGELVGLASADAFTYLDKHVCAHLIQKKSEIPFEVIHPSQLPCVQGTYSSIEDSCICTPGYIGTLCETSICYNYCVEGECSMSNGKPSCKCPVGRSGKRCQVDECVGYCYKGKCSLEDGGVKQCTCDPGWSGNRCDLSEGFCTYVCHKGLWSKFNCSCDEIKASALTESDITYQWKVGVFSLAGLVGILIVVILALAVRTFKLGRRPRLRRTYKVTQPRSNKPQPAKTSPDCAIAIENCCNMNICETPCYEPELRLSSGKSKKEEKKGLLGEMEVQPDLENI
nr:protein cueball isoform X1 [Halyomorpha halys]